MPQVDGRAVRVGAAVALVVGVVAVLAYQLVDAVAHFTEESNWVFAFFAVVAAGWVAGGGVAARRRPDAPLTHGALAAIAGYAGLALVVTVISAATGGGVPFWTLVLLLTIAAFCGIVGALAGAFRR